MFTLNLNSNKRHASKNVYKILVGNKCDCTEKRQVSYDQGKEFADSHGMKFIETSAKTSLNVGDSFISMTSDIIKQIQAKEVNKHTDQGNVNLSTSKGKDLKTKDCCK